jgi:hypothetical protein
MDALYKPTRMVRDHLLQQILKERGGKCPKTWTAFEPAIGEHLPRIVSTNRNMPGQTAPYQVDFSAGL